MDKPTGSEAEDSDLRVGEQAATREGAPGGPLIPLCLVIFMIIVYMLAPHSSSLAWKILWMEESGRLQSMGSLRVRYD